MTDANSSVSTNSETPADSLTLQQLHAELTARGVPIGYSALSEFLKTGDISDQLKSGGAGNRRAFHPDVAEILAAFFPEYRAAGGKSPQAPAMLRSFLKQRNNTGDGFALVPQIAETAKQADSIAVAEAQGRAQGLAQSERVLTAKEAADVLSVSVRQLRRTVKPYRRFGNSPTGDRWLLSDLLRRE